MICFNFIHDSSSCIQVAHRVKLNLSHLDASHDTELLLNSKLHSTCSQVTCNWHSRKMWLSANFARPSPPTTHHFTAHPHDRPCGEGLAARLLLNRMGHSHQGEDQVWLGYSVQGDRIVCCGQSVVDSLGGHFWGWTVHGMTAIHHKFNSWGLINPFRA